MRRDNFQHLNPHELVDFFYGQWPLTEKEVVTSNNLPRRAIGRAKKELFKYVNSFNSKAPEEYHMVLKYLNMNIKARKAFKDSWEKAQKRKMIIQFLLEKFEQKKVARA